MKIIEFLKKSFYEDLYSDKKYLEKKDIALICVKLFWIVVIFFLAIPVFFLIALFGSIVMNIGLIIIFLNVPEFFLEGQWIVYGLVLGMIFSLILHSVSREKKSPYEISMTLLQHLAFLMLIFLALALWVLILYWIK